MSDVSVDPKVDVEVRPDARAHFTAQLTAMGYNVPAEFKQAKARARELAKKRNVPRVHIDEVDWLCVGFLNALSRRIESRPRIVERAVGFGDNPPAKQFATAIDDIERVSREGGDLTARLSTKLQQLQYNDLLLNDWRIHHLHLGSDTNGVGERTGPVLFVFLSGNRMCFLDVMEHDPSPWAQQRLVEIIHANWPQLVSEFRSPIPGESLSDEQIAALRAKNGNVCIRTKDGTSYVPFGWGQMASGTNSLLRMRSDRFLRRLEDLEKGAVQNAQTIRLAIKQQRGLEVDRLRIGLKGVGTDFMVIEKQSGSGFESFFC